LNRQTRTRHDRESIGRIIGCDIGRRDRHIGLAHCGHEECRKYSGQPRQFECRCRIVRVTCWDRTKWTLQGICEVSRGVRQRKGGRQIEPRRACHRDGAFRIRRVGLVGQLKRRSARARQQDIGPGIAIESREPHVIRCLYREDVQFADCNDPPATQCIYCPGRSTGIGKQIVQNENSVTRGTWSDGLSQLRIGS
jgi:hypothetical protein